MSNEQDTPDEIDFSKGKRGLHHIPHGATVLMPVSIELVTEILWRDIEIHEALK